MALGIVTVAALLLAPTASAQSAEVEIVEMEASPLVVPSSEATVELTITLETSLDELNVTVVVEEPEEGRQLSSTARTLVLDEGSRATAPIDITVPADAEPGLRSVVVDSARDANGTQVDVTGSRSTIFFVHEDAPVAGGEGPIWPQPAGDSQNSGRTLEQGPLQVDLVRWTATSVDGQPFHDPVVDGEGHVTAVTWSGVMHRYDASGEELWEPALRLGASVPFPPATAGGNVVVATGEGEVRAVEPDRSQDWKVDRGDDLLSGPTVAADGTIYVVERPWTVVAISPEGAVESQQGLSEPSAYDPPQTSSPSPTPGPPVAVDRDGTVVAITEGGIQELTSQLTPLDEIPCNCTPRGVTLAPGSSIALVVGDQEIVAVDRDTGTIEWRTGDADRPGSELDGQIHAAPVVGWGSEGSQPVFIADGEGSIHVVTLGGAHIRSWRNVFGPIHGQAAVDADGHLYVADSCNLIRSFTTALDSRWTKTLNSPGCTDRPTGVVPNGAGGVLWVSPDGKLRSIGKDRPPEPQFTVSWKQDRGHVFDARDSSDPDGSPLSYTWRFDDATVKRGATVAHRFDELGNHTIRLTVDDGSSKVTTSRQMAINLPPDPRITEVADGETLRLDANATTDPDDPELTYWWRVDGDRGHQGPSIELAAEGPRVYEVELFVSDGDLNATAQRTILAPTADAWTNETIATYSGDCPAGVCTVPGDMTLTDGTLLEIAVANGIGRTMTVEPELPAVPGGPEQVAIAPRDQARLFVRAEEGHDAALTLSPVGVDDDATLPLTLQPAAADVTWEIADASDLEAGTESAVELAFEGTPPPADVSLRFSLRSGSEALAVEDVNLEAGEAPNGTIDLTFTPEEPGEFTGAIVAATADGERAQVTPDRRESTFTVTEPGLTTLAARTTSENPYLSAGVALGLVLAITSGVVGWYRNRDEEPTQMQPVESTSPTSVGPDDGATVAQGFMPRKVDRFHVDRVLGEGGFGTTYLARDSVLERDVVLKDLENVGDGDERDLLLHEAKTAANLQHSNVVVVHDVIEEEGRLLLVMEHVEGGTLDEHMEAALPTKQALPIARDILDGLAALHEAGIVHRDLKPSNILLTPDGTPKITDFGVAVSLEESPDQADAFVGTPRYMAPEQLAGDPAGPRADVYAAGALVYRMLTGDHHLGLGPETPPPEELLERDVRLPAPELPDVVNEVLATALARDPQDRYEDTDFAEALATLDPDGSRTVEGLPEG